MAMVKTRKSWQGKMADSKQPPKRVKDFEKVLVGV